MNDKVFTYESSGEKVRDPQRIQVLLKRIIDERTLLTITLPGVSGHFTSAIIETDKDQGFILLDELTPQAGHNQFLKKRQLVVQARLQGVNIQFKGELLGLSHDEAGIAYRLTYPTSLVYHQKRSHFRVKLGVATPVIVRFYPENASPIEGELTDISEGGVCALLTISAETLKPGERFPCSIHIDAKDVIRCDLEIRSSRDEGDRAQRQRVGFRFIDLTPQQSKQVSRMVARMQREALRKHPH